MQVSTFIKTCQEQIDILKNSINQEEETSKGWLGIATTKSNADIIAHKHGVVRNSGACWFSVISYLCGSTVVSFSNTLKGRYFIYFSLSMLIMKIWITFSAEYCYSYFFSNNRTTQKKKKERKKNMIRLHNILATMRQSSWSLMHSQCLIVDNVISLNSWILIHSWIEMAICLFVC